MKKAPPGADDIWQTYAGNSSIQSVAITGPLNPRQSERAPPEKAAGKDRLPHPSYFFSAVNVPLPTSPYTTVPLIFVSPSRVPL